MISFSLVSMLMGPARRPADWFVSICTTCLFRILDSSQFFQKVFAANRRSIITGARPVYYDNYLRGSWTIQQSPLPIQIRCHFIAASDCPDRSSCAFAAKGRKPRNGNSMLRILPSQARVASQFQIPERAAAPTASLITKWLNLRLDFKEHLVGSKQMDA